MADENPRIETKLYPPRRRPDLLRRSRLLEFMHERIDYKLLLLCAPAGYGKTTLLVDYIHDLDIPVCWISLDESDRDPVVFVDYLLASLSHRFPDFEPDLPAGQWRAWDDGRLTRWATALVNEMQRTISDYFFVVLDDYHLVNNSLIINQLMDCIITHLPENCQIIIASRTEPTLTPRGLALLMAQQQVAALGVGQFRFTATEVQTLIVQNFSQEISSEAANLLAQESEGWITGILLTARQMDQGLLAAMAPGRGGRQRLYDYLTNEVLARQPSAVRQFLEETAILNEMNAELCDTLRGRDDSEAQLAYIEQQNLFLFNIPRDDGAWYRYHHLFREFLLDRIERQSPSRLQRLHLTAAALMERHKQWDQALQHYLKGGAPQRAAELIIDLRHEIREAERWQTLGQWLDRLPPSLFPLYPHLIRLQARMLMETGAPEQSVQLFEQAVEKFTQMGNNTTAAWTLHDKAMALRVQGRLQTSLGVLKQLLNLIDSEKDTDTALFASALCQAGIVSSQLGDLEQGNDYLRRALQQYRQTDSAHSQAVTHDALGTNLIEGGNLTGAQVQFERALTLWESIDSPSPIAVTLNNLGVIYSLRGAYTQALGYYERALHEARRNGIPRMEAFVLAGIGDVHRDTSNLDQALAAYSESQTVAEQAGETQLSVYLLDALGETHRRLGNYPQALNLARRAYEWAQEHNATLDLGRCATTLGAISYEQGRIPPALRYLDQARDLLQVSQAHRELAVAHLHRAQAFYRAARKQDALAELEKTVDCLLELGYDSFLAPLAAQMQSLLTYATEQDIGGQILTNLLDQARQTEKAHPASPQATLDEPVPTLRIQGLGHARVFIGEREITSSDWRSITSRDLFFFLLCRGPATKDQIANIFWPDLSPGQLRSTFHITVYRLRRALDPLETIIFEDKRYHFNRRLQYSFDVETFEHLLVQAAALATVNPTRAIELYSQATGLYRGDFMIDYASPHDDWRLAEANRLTEKYLNGLESLGNLLLQQEEQAAALDAFQRAAKCDPYRESARWGVMYCLAKLGRRTEALRYYQELEQFIQTELGALPTPEIEELYQRILSNKPLATPDTP